MNRVTKRLSVIVDKVNRCLIPRVDEYLGAIWPRKPGNLLKLDTVCCSSKWHPGAALLLL